MKIATKISLFCITLFLAATTAMAQTTPEAGTVGLSASLQSNQTNLEIPIWASDHVVIAPIIGLYSQENNYTTINIGVSPKFYQPWGDNFASYVGAQGIVQRTSPETGPEDTDLLLGAIGGGEYFFNQHFSLGFEGQLNFLSNDNGNNALSTGAAVVGSVYF